MSGSRRLERHKRIRQSKEFQSTYAEGKKLYTPLFVLYYRQGRAPQTRVGLTVSKKVGNSVERVRCKRLLREVFRLHQDEIPRGLDLVFNARRALVAASFCDADVEFQKCLPRLTFRSERPSAS